MNINSLFENLDLIVRTIDAFGEPSSTVVAGGKAQVGEAQ